MPANIYNMINNMQKGIRREMPTANSTPSNQGNPVNTQPVSDGVVHEAEIVDTPKESTRQVRTKATGKHPLGVRVGMGILDHVINAVEQEHGLHGLGKTLAPHLHEIVQESPLRNVPDSLIGLAGRFLLNQMKKG